MNLTPPALIVITGLPCSGKSILAQRLRAHAGWPLVAKDALKETLFATLGWQDRAWSRRLSVASYALLFQMAEELLAARQPVIVEGNFRAAQHEAAFVRLVGAHPLIPVQILCTADSSVLVGRFRERVLLQARHPGHADAESAAEIEAEMRVPFAPLALRGHSFEWDSTHANEQKLQRLLVAVLAAAQSPPQDQRPSTSSTSA